MRKGSWVAAIAVLLTGCAGVPTSGPVEHYQPQQAAATSGVQVAPLPPADGATQLVVVEGFLHAMGTYQPNYQVARQYLTASAAADWRPESGVQVYADGYPPTETDQSVVLVAPVTGAVDARGVYQAVSGQVRHDFGLVKDGAGQWRISNPPQGLLVSRYLFTTGFQAVNLFFASDQSPVLLPDPRFFPVTGDITLRAAQEVVAGSSSWLSPLVSSRLLPQVRVVSVDRDEAGVARVELADVEGVDAVRREQLLAQLTFTLCQFDQVRAVQVMSGGLLWAGPQGRTELTPGSLSTYDPADQLTARPAYAVVGDHLGRQASQLTWSGFDTVQAGMPKLGGLAISRNAQTWAGVSADQTRLYSGPIVGKGVRVLRNGPGLLRPFFGRGGELWSPAASLRDLRIYRELIAVGVTINGAPPGRLVAASLAPDGARLALVLAEGDRTRVGVMRVHSTGNSVVIEGWRSVELNPAAVGPGRVLDIGWNSITDLALLRLNSGQQTSVGVARLDGAQFTEIGPGDVTGLRALTAMPGRPPLLISRAGQLYRFDGEFNWLPVAGGVTAASYPG